jgi:peptidoglycan/LPS O-acetylase OafA/YrhL
MTDLATIPRRLGRVPAFDGIRGVAVLLVVWSHMGLIRVFPHSWKLTGGFLGVDAFFVLSGFLITALMLREQIDRIRVHFLAFYRRRALRLLPVIVAFGIAHYVFSRDLRLPLSTEHSSLLAMAFYYMNWKAVWAPPISAAIGQLWSLAVEEQFYLVWPIVIALLSVRARTRTVLLVLVPAILVVAARRAILFDHGVATSRLLIGTDTRADTLLIGALLAHLWVRAELPKRGVRTAAWVSAAFLLFCVLRCTPNTPFLYAGGFTLIAAAVAVILLAILETDWAGARALAARPIRAVGRVSYGLYVWHPLVFFWVWWETRHWARLPRLAVVVGATIAVTYGSWKLIEQPFLRWKDRLERADRERIQATALDAGSSA